MDESALSLSDRLVRLVFLTLPFLILVTGVVIFAFWQFDAVRMAALEWRKEGNPDVLEASLADPSAEIRKRACIGLIEGEHGLDSEPLVETLVRRPNLAARCLGDIERRYRETENRPRPPWVGHHRVLAYRVSKRWFETMVSPEDEPAFPPCRAVDLIDGFGGMSGIPVDSYLLTLSVLGTTEKVRSCGVRAMGGSEAVREALREGRELADGVFSQYLRGFVTVGFSSHVGAQAEELPYQHGVEELASGITATEMQDWVIGRSCEIVQHFDPERRVVRAFMPVFEADACHAGEEPPAAFYERPTWGDVCSTTYEFYRRHELQSPPKALCHSLAASSRRRAIRTARNRMFVALRNQKANVVDRGGSPAISGPKPGDVSAPSWVLRHRRNRYSEAPILEKFTQQLGPMQ